MAMGSTIILAEAPQRDMLWANRAMRATVALRQPGTARPTSPYLRLPGMGAIDSFYYSDDNVDERTVSRFYGYTLEVRGRGPSANWTSISGPATFSADGQTDYSAMLDRVTVPTLMVAGEGDIISDVPSTERPSSPWAAATSRC